MDTPITASNKTSTGHGVPTSTLAAASAVLIGAVTPKPSRSLRVVTAEPSDDRRGLDVTGAWLEGTDDQLRLSPLTAGGPLHGYRGHLDLAVGALAPTETWQEAAAGAYDTRWRASLSILSHLRADTRGITFIRFAHEWNAPWHPWRVTSDDVAAFTASWTRYRRLQQELYPQARLVFCVSRRSIDTSFAWTEAIPAAGDVDVLGVDYYIDTDSETSALTEDDFAARLYDHDEHGAPAGLAAHLATAARHDLPLAISEWSSLTDHGPSTGFIVGMRRFAEANAGTGPGQVLYDVPLVVPDPIATIDPISGA